MREFVLAFAGPIKSGKTSLSEGVALALNWKFASFGRYLLEESLKRGADGSRESLQSLGEEMISNGWKGFVGNVLMSANWRKGQDLVVDGVRHLEALQAIQDLTFPSHTILVYVDTEESVRTQRLAELGVDEWRLRKFEAHTSEAQLSVLAKLADFSVDGANEKTANIESVVTWFRRIQSSLGVRSSE